MLNRNRFLLVLVAVFCFSSLLLAGPAVAEEQLGSDGVLRQTLQQPTPQPAYSMQEEGTGSITLQVHTGGAPIDQWAVNVFQAGESNLDQIWSQVQCTPGWNEPGDVRTVVISGLNADPSQTYYVSMTSYDALYLATFTGGELGSTKVVKKDDSYITLDVSVPFSEVDGDASIDLHYRWPNGIRTHVGQVWAGAAIPAGNYSAQAWSWGPTWSYSLFQPPVDLSVDTTLTFAADDIATVAVTVDLESVDASLEKVETYQFPSAGYLNTITHVQCLPGSNTYSTDVSKGEYHTFGYVVRLTDSTGDYAYKFWRRDVGLSDDLETTSLDLTGVQYMMDCRPVSPGETVYMEDLFANGSFSYSRQPERWVVAKSTEDGDYLDPTGTLNLYHSSADLSSPVCSIRPEDGCFPIPADLPIGEYHAIFTPDSFGPVPLQFGTGTIRVEAGMPFSTTISGTLALPVSGAATVRLTATDPANPESPFSIVLSFDASTDSLPFEIETGAFTAYHLQYEVLSGGAGLIPWGYFNGSQFVSDQGQTAPVIPGQPLVLTLSQSMPEYYQIVIHIQGEYYWSPSVWVQQAEQSGSSYRYVPVPDGPAGQLTIHSEPELGGVLLGISGLSFADESNRYAVGISMGNSLFPVEVTSADLGNPITLAVGPDYQPLAVSLPFTPDPADDLPIFLVGRDANGVAWLQGAVKPGAQIPEGAYDVHLAVQTGGESYSLRAKDYTHSADSGLDFAASDLITLSVSVPEQVQVASAEQLAGSDQQTTMVPWAWDESTQQHSILINKSVSYQQSVVYLEWNDWKYETVLPGTSLTEDLDLGAIVLQGKANLPKNSFLPGEEIWADSDSFSIVDQTGRVWQVMRFYGDRWIFAEGELLLTKSDSSDSIECPFSFGRATLPSAAGSYQLSYQLPGSMLPIVASLPVDITIGGAVVYGQVLLPGGTQPYGPSWNSWVDVSLRNLDSQREWWAGVDGNGCYAFVEAIPEGRYELTAMPRGQFGGSVPLEVTVDDEGTPTAVNLVLTSASITGWVLNPGSEGTAFVIGEQCDPDAGVQLYQVMMDGKEVRAAQANIARDGSYSLGGNLPSGTYRLYARAWGNSNTYAPAIPLTFYYEAGTPVTEQNIALTVPLVMGKVLQPNGDDFRRENDSWADVCLRSPDGQERWFGIENNGRFLIGGNLPEGSYTLWAGARGDGNPYADGPGEPVLLTAGQTKVQNVRLASPTLTGRVLKPDGYDFIPTNTSTVDLCLRSSLNGPDLAWTGLRSDGTFRFGEVVPNGTYYLIAWDRGNDNPYARSLPEEVTIDDADQTEVRDIALTSPIIIGQVLVPDGSEPFTIAFGDNKGVHVTLRTADEKNSIVSETALNWQPCNGSFRLGGNIPSGDYLLYADTWGSDNLYTNAEPLTVTVPSGGPLTQNICLTNPQLQGRVLAPDGDPISFGPDFWADVRLRDADGRDVTGAGTDQDGNFSIGGNIAAGDYYLFAFPRGAGGGYARSLPVAVQLTAGLQTQSIRLTTPGALLYTISGELALPDEDIAGAGGIAVVIKAIPRGFNEHGPITLEDKAQVTTVVIPVGEHAANYSISAPLPPEGFDYILQYVIDAGCIDDYPQYRETAFYSDLFSGQTVQYPIADWLGLSTTGDYPGKNLVITKLRTISGTVALPNQATAPDGGLAVTIYCVSGEGGWQQSYEQLASQALGSTKCTIAAAESQAEFEINSLPPNERFIGWYDQFGHPEIQGYRLMYQFAAPDGSPVYGFFHPNGSVGNFAAAAWLDATDADITDVVIGLVAFAPAPNADVDGDGDVDVTDLALVAQAYGTDDEDYDLNQNGRVDLYDLVLVAMQLNLQTS